MKEVFSIYDSKAEQYMQPMFLNTRGEAIRSFSDITNKEGTTLYLHPEDFTLMHLGTYDPNKGIFTNNLTPVSLGLALEFKKPDLQMRFPATEEGK